MYMPGPRDTTRHGKTWILATAVPEEIEQGLTANPSAPLPHSDMATRMRLRSQMWLGTLCWPKDRPMPATKTPATAITREMNRSLKQFTSGQNIYLSSPTRANLQETL